MPEGDPAQSAREAILAAMQGTTDESPEDVPTDDGADGPEEAA